MSRNRRNDVGWVVLRDVGRSTQMRANGGPAVIPHRKRHVGAVLDCQPVIARGQVVAKAAT